MNEEDEKGLLDPRSGFRTTLGLGVELVGNTGLDAFSFVPGSQQAGSALLNILAQKIRGGKFSKGEVLAAAATSQIPGLSQAKAITKAGKILRGSAKGGITGGITTTSMTAVDEGRAPTIGEFATGVGSGAVLGGMFETAANTKQVQKFTKDLGTAIDRSGITMPLKIARGELIGDLTGGTFRNQPRGAKFARGVIEAYENRALLHRVNRLNEAKDLGIRRRDYMKDFNERVENVSGQEFMLVRKRKTPNKQDPIAKENYEIRSLYSIEQQMIKDSGWLRGQTPTTRQLQQTRAGLNKLKTEFPDRYYSALMEYGNRAYIEHKVARGMAWFWNRKEKDPSFAPWVKATGRNEAENLRLLFREPYKEIKDSTEMTLKARNLLINDDPQRLVIDIEDPITGDLFKRNNPGNLLIRRAGDGEVVGLIEDFYQDLWSEGFKKSYEKNFSRLLLDDIPVRFRALPGEGIAAYRKRVFQRRINQALDGTYDVNTQKQQSQVDTAEFYDLFERKLGWITEPDYIRNMRAGVQDPADLDIQRFNVKDLEQIARNQEIDLSLLDGSTLAKNIDMITEATQGQFAKYSSMNDPMLFEDAQEFLELIRPKTGQGEQGLIQEVGEENLRTAIMELLFRKYGIK